MFDQIQFLILGIMRRLADYNLNRATSWDEIEKAQRRFVRDYDTQSHCAHREHRDNRHSPQDALRGVLARTVLELTLALTCFATQFTHHPDQSGFIRFRLWRLHAEAGLAKQSVTVHRYTNTLKIEYQEADLALYTAEWHKDTIHITAVSNVRVIETNFVPLSSRSGHLALMNGCFSKSCPNTLPAPSERRSKSSRFPSNYRREPTTSRFFLTTTLPE